MEGGGGNAGYGKGLGFPWNYWEATGSKTADWNGLLNPNHVTRGSESAHLTCLNLGKRHYLEQGGESLGGKKGRGVVPSSSCSSSSSSSSLLPPVPRCQVEGCQVPLTHAKDYHRRHKVCELHSKAPKVVVLGLEQRFCQQCSRFHVVSEFDDSKRSCRRRLAGHNERRRKSAHDFTNPRNHSQDNHVMDGAFPCISSMTGRALSLLSSKTSWVSSADVSSRSSAALRELIAENRAAVLARQLFSDRGLHSGPESAGAQEYLTHMPHQHQMSREVGHLVPEWSHLDGPMAHVTLDLMQPPDSSEFMSGRSRVKADEECCEIWKSLEGTHVL